jgi:hypothetical protein
MGADIRIEPLPAQTAEPTADIHVRAAPLRGIRVPEALSVWLSTSFLCCSCAAAAQGETIVAVPRNCGSRKATVWP